MKRALWVVPALAAAAALLRFYSVLDGGFIQLDDPRHLMENPAYHTGFLEGLRTIWRAPYFGLYIPLTYSLWKGVVWWATPSGGSPTFDPVVFHLVSLLLHAINSSLVAFILFRLLETTPGGPPAPPKRIAAAALAGALVFAWHPVQVESVAWISSTKDLFSSLFALIALALYLAPGNTGNFTARPGRYAIASLCFLAALLAKPSTVVLPLLCAWVGALWLKIPRRELARSFLPWVALALPLCWFTKSLQPDDPAQVSVALLMRPLVALDALGFYLGKLALPIGLALDYGRRPEIAFREVFWATGPLALIAISYAFAMRKRFPAGWLGLGILVIGIAPVLGFVPFLFQIFSTTADRYLYLPILGLGLVVSFLAVRAQSAVRLLTPAAIAGLGIITGAQLGCWRDGVHIFVHSVQTNPKSVLAHNNLGVEWQTRGQFPLAAHHFGEALRLAPQRPDVNSNLGAALVAGGSVREGLEYLHRAEKLLPTSQVALYNLARSYLRLGRYDEAIAYAERILADAPDNPRALRVIALSRDARSSGASRRS